MACISLYPTDADLSSCDTGKNSIAQRLLERYAIPYFSQDHLKMGLIRSGQTTLTPEDDAALQDLLWPITREMVRTVLENKQHLIVEGGYIPFTYQQDFTPAELEQIHFRCLVLSPDYIAHNFAQIKAYASTIEQRGSSDDYLTVEQLQQENLTNLNLCKQHHCPYVLIADHYPTFEALIDLLQLPPSTKD